MKGAMTGNEIRPVKRCAGTGGTITNSPNLLSAATFSTSSWRFTLPHLYGSMPLPSFVIPVPRGGGRSCLQNGSVPFIAHHSVLRAFFVLSCDEFVYVSQRSVLCPAYAACRNSACGFAELNASPLRARETMIRASFPMSLKIDRCFFIIRLLTL